MKRIIVSALLAVPLAIASFPKEAAALDIIIGPTAPVQFGGGGVGLGVWIPGYWGYYGGRRQWYPGRWDRSRYWNRDRYDSRYWDGRWNRDRQDPRRWDRDNPRRWDRDNDGRRDRDRDGHRHRDRDRDRDRD